MKIYIGNLPWSIDEEALKKLVSNYEVEEVTLISDKFSGRSKGFGFVTASDEVGQKIIAELNEKEIEGRKLTVNEARPQEERPARSSDGPRRNFGNSRRSSDGPRRNFSGNRRY